MTKIKEVPFVSVVMSVYDGVCLKHLRIAISSILHQNFKHFEFLIVLDGITRKEIILFLKKIKNSNNRVRLIYIAENKGLANALNKTISSANGEFIIRMDADDISYPDRLQKLVEYMKANNKIDVAGSFVEEFCEGSKIKRLVDYPIKHQDMKKLFAKRNPIAHSSVIFRRRFFDKAGFYPLFSMRNEDTLLWLSGFVNGCNFSNLPEILYAVRFNKEMGFRRNSLRKSFSDFIDRLRVIIDLHASWINAFYAFGVFIVQILPYPLYNYLRYKVISKK